MRGLPKRCDLAMDGRCASAGSHSKLETSDGVTELVKWIAMWADMKLVTSQTIFVDDFEEDGVGKCVKGEWYGLSGIGMITTSHIAVHYWPCLYYYQISVSSCKQYDHLDIVDKIENYMCCKSIMSSKLEYNPENNFYVCGRIR